MTRRRVIQGVIQAAALAVVQSMAAGCQRSAPVALDTEADKGRTPVNKTIKVKVFNSGGELIGPVEAAFIVKTDAQWKAQLTADQYRIARGKDTERAFCGNLLDNHLDGVYTCICCGLPLFSSTGKFESGSGWPSFFQPIAAENVVEQTDRGLGMDRTEILCARCGGHLGHVFDDGPRPTGLRFCVNSESMAFTAKADLAKLADPAAAKTK